MGLALLNNSAVQPYSNCFVGQHALFKTFIRAATTTSGHQTLKYLWCEQAGFFQPKI